MLTANSILLTAAVFCASSFLANAQTTVARAIVFQAANFNGSEQLRQVGTLEFTQQASGGAVQIRGRLAGLPQGERGFHVHDKGDLGNMCNNAGDHFNPDKHDHAAPTDTARHVGDLGNINVGADGVVNIDLSDSVIQLNGRNSIIGRAIVVHEKRDDLGKGATDVSKKTGDAGARIACGVISIASESYLPVGGSAYTISASILMSFVSLIVIAYQQIC
uniref:Superoxide dismutase [Cu-Zn] n=1 Tax=Plectus sambesii TaxID=2011161 RepID=A0A914XQC6_9BILA